MRGSAVAAREGNDGVWRSVLTALLLGITAYAGGSTASPARETAGTLRVLASDFAPFYFEDENGEPAGLEHRILADFAETEGLALEVVWVAEFDDIIEALLRGDGDIIASTLTITSERRQKVDFSAPYFPTRVVLVQRRDSALPERDSLAGRKAVTIRGTTYEKSLTELASFRLVYVTTEEEMYAALAAGGADVLATDSANFLWVGSRFPELEIVGSVSGRQFYGFAVRKGDPLRARLDSHLERLMREETYWRFLKESFGEIVSEYIDDLKQDFLLRSQ